MPLPPRDVDDATGIRARVESLRDLVRALPPHEPVVLPDVARDEALSRRFSMLFERLFSDDSTTAQDAADDLVPVVLEFEAKNSLWLVEVLLAVLRTQPAGDASKEELEARKQFVVAVENLLAAAPSEDEIKADAAHVAQQALADCGGDKDKALKLSMRRFQSSPRQRAVDRAHRRFMHADSRMAYYHARPTYVAPQDGNRRASGTKPIKRRGSRRTTAPTRGDPDPDGDLPPPAPGPGARWQALLGAELEPEYVSGHRLFLERSNQ